MEGYMIKEAAKMLGVETHVLRYWEEELGLDIQRNSMGHRYYDERDIKMFKEVMELKNRGFALKDIKQGIDSRKNTDIKKTKTSESDSEKLEESASVYKQEEEIERRDDVSGTDVKVVDFKVAQMQAVMNKIVANALRENRGIITASIKSEITEDVMRQFDTVMREKEEKEEARFRKLDECLRQIQRANEEVAATKPRKRFGRRRL